MWWIAFHFQQEVDRFQDPRLKDTYLGPFHLIARYMTMFIRVMSQLIVVMTMVMPI